MFRARHVGWIAVLVLTTALMAWRVAQHRSTHEIPFEARSTPPVAAPLCPWREPERDLPSFFPEANGQRLETHILSGRRVELAARLGRAPAPDESVLHTFRAMRDGHPVGAILTRRVKGSHGAIELVLALDTNRQARALKIQRLREPASLAAALENHDWLRTLRSLHDGREPLSADAWADIPPEARPAAAAIAEGVRSLLILFATAEETLAQKNSGAPHH